jgi:hypothetical protein
MQPHLLKPDVRVSILVSYVILRIHAKAPAEHCYQIGEKVRVWTHAYQPKEAS